MIYIISLVMLMVGLMSGAVLVSMGPNVSAIVEKDIAQKAFNNNELFALQYGDIAARAGSVIPDSCAAAVANPNSFIQLDIGSLYSRNLEVVTNVTATIRVCNEPASMVIKPSINQTQQNYTDFF